MIIAISFSQIFVLVASSSRITEAVSTKNSRLRSLNCENHTPHVIDFTRDSTHVALPAKASAAADTRIYIRVYINLLAVG